MGGAQGDAGKAAGGLRAAERSGEGIERLEQRLGLIGGCRDRRALCFFIAVVSCWRNVTVIIETVEFLED